VAVAYENARYPIETVKYRFAPDDPRRYDSLSKLVLASYQRAAMDKFRFDPFE